MRPRIHAAFGFDRSDRWWGDSRPRPEQDPSWEWYLVGNLTNSRTLIHSERLADVGSWFVFPWRSDL